MIFYRKYRPQSLIDLIGQEHIVSSLNSAFSSGKLASAYLFCGPRGTGKTSTARILSKMVNCSSEKDIPCNQCDSCLSITDGSNMDVLEIDAASNRGIDDIRELREKIKLAPSSSKKKVYIIDEVHMLSTEAFNALLKTLEEPPSHVLFILATTELQKIPETILSRVIKMDFKLASLESLTKALEKIIREEKIEVEAGVIEALAKSAQGSFRDAVKLLDQLSVDTPITLEKVKTSLLSLDFNFLEKIAESLIKNDSKEALNLFLEKQSLGINIKEFNLNLIEILRAVLFVNYGVLEPVKLNFGSDKFETISNLAKLSNTQKLLKIISNFEEAFGKLKTTSIPSFPTEVAIIESSLESVSVEEKIVVEEVMSKAVFTTPVTDQIPETPSVSNKIATDIKISDEMNMIKDKWNYILETIRSDNFSLEAMLKQVKVVNCEGSILTLEVPYAFHQRIIEAPKSRNLLESVVAEVLGKNIKVATVLGKREIQNEDIANVEVAADDEIIRVASEIFNSESVN